MHANHDDYQAWLAELARRSAEDLRRYHELVSRVMASAGSGDARLREQMSRIATEETARYLQDASRLSAQYYSSLYELGRRYTERFLEQCGEQAPRRHARDETTAEPRRTIDYRLRGVTGTIAHGAFVVENKREAPVDVSFVVSDFRDLDTGGRFRAPIDFRPSHLPLDPHGEGLVSLELPLQGEVFLPHHRYVVDVIVRGHDDLHLRLTLEVDPAEASPAETKVAADDAADTAGAVSGGKKTAKGRQKRSRRVKKR
jgi:hypothetical protein